jgi:hypothetical protein
MMQLLTDQNGTDLETLTAVIARSQIVVHPLAIPARPLPAGFDATDVAVLDWIVAEGRRLGRGLVLI